MSTEHDSVLHRLPSMPQTVRIGAAPDWDMTRLEHRPCPACSSNVSAQVVMRPDGLIVDRCASCGMLYIARVPHESQVNAFYDGYYTLKRYPTRPSSWLSLRLKASRDPFIRALDSTGGVRGQSLCEVGCSTGRWLEVARCAGAKVHGVEIDTRSHAALTAKRISFDSAMDPSKQYDIICMFDVLEHLVNPIKLLGQAAASLKSDGRLLLLVPNGGQFNDIGVNWVGFRVDLEHLNYFSIATMARTLSSQGLLIEQYWTRFQPFTQRSPSVSSRGGGVLAKVKAIALSKDDPMTAGTYGLMVLARRQLCPN